MKCKSCGANFETTELKCPFCGTDNKKGMEWTQAEKSARESMERTGRYIKSSLPLYICDHICNIVITIGVVLTVVLILLVNMDFGSGDKTTNYDKADEQLMEACYQNDDWETLTNHMNKYNLRFDKENRYKKYSEYVELRYDYDRVIEKMNRFLNQSQKDREEYCEYGSVYDLIYACSDYLYIDYKYAYREGEEVLDPENQITYDENKVFFFAFLKNRLLLTEEECAALADHDVYGDEAHVLVSKVYERNGWRYEVDED